MLTKRQNLIETIKGGNPDRYVNQFEFMHMLYTDPVSLVDKWPKYGERNVKDMWGVTRSYPENTPGPFPVDTPDMVLCPDVEDWKKYVKAPQAVFDDAMWEVSQKEAEKIDRNEEFVTVMLAPGLFERLHSFLGMESALISFYESPESVKELIKYVEEWELTYVEQLCEKLHPDCIFHHDDWGSQMSTFFSPAMFDDFFLESYKRIYGYLKSHGVQLIVHHSDSYAATLVPEMIEMGIDIWQGVMTANNIPALIETYGGKITFMGGIDSASVDYPGWKPDVIESEVEKACKTFGKKFFIPNTTMGGDYSTFPGVYETIGKAIEKMSKLMF